MLSVYLLALGVLTLAYLLVVWYSRYDARYGMVWFGALGSDMNPLYSGVLTGALGLQ